MVSLRIMRWNALCYFVFGILAGFLIPVCVNRVTRVESPWSDNSRRTEDGTRYEVSVGSRTYYGSDVQFISGYPSHVYVTWYDDTLMLSGDVISVRKVKRAEEARTRE